jgi:hypothetical protein
VEDVRFNDLDLNNDGVLTSSEWRGSMSEFDRLRQQQRRRGQLVRVQPLDARRTIPGLHPS